MKNDKIRKTLNILLAVAVFGAWGQMVFSGGGTLADAGLSSLKYFTVLSNLLEGFACLVWLCRWNTGHNLGKQDPSSQDRPRKDTPKAYDPGRRSEILKYVATVAVSITFLVVMTFLGPLYGYPSMFEGANLWLHLVVPVGAILEQIFLSGADFGRKENLLTAIPVLLYGAVYLSNILLNGVGEWPDTNDWYSFMMWGYPGAAVIYSGLTAVSLGLGWLFRKARFRR